MRTIVVIGALILSSCGSREPPRDAADRDWLSVEPPRLAVAQQEKYLAALASVFADENGLVGSGCLQVLVVPRSGPEYIVYIDCLGEREGMPARVVRLVAKQDVSEALAEVGFEGASKIGVERKEATLNAADSRLLREIWWAMLERARPTQSMDQALPRYHFSACKALTGCRGAVGAKLARGARSSALIEIAELLGRLTDSDVRGRVALVEAIRARAANLKASLRHDKPSAPHESENARDAE